MKKAILFLAVMLFSVGASAQIWRVVKTDGTVLNISVADVSYVTVLARDFSTHEYVDLGLPSGTLWATCNVGAGNPEDYGDYFAWAETDPKNDYRVNTYVYFKGDENHVTKYCFNSDYGYDGFIDNKTELEASDDAATMNWGNDWCTPSITQQNELRTKCTWIWTTKNGVYGYKVVGTNGKSIFLPAAGTFKGTSVNGAASSGNYWSRTISSYRPGSANYLKFDSDNVDWNYAHRNEGKCVRPVRVSQE